MDCQTRLGLMLPYALVELLRTQNGGFINYNLLPLITPTLWGEDELDLYLIPGISAQEPKHCGLSNFQINWIFGSDPGDDRMNALRRRVGNPQHIVPLERDAHCLIALDYRKNPFNDNPPVIWMSTDDDCEFIEIAQDFETLLCQLRKRPQSDPPFVC